MVNVPIRQASSSIPPLSTPIINLSPPIPVITNPDLATRIFALEKRSADLEKKNQLQEKTTQALASRVYKLEHHDLYSKIEKKVNEVVKEAVHNALQALLHHTTLYEALKASMHRDNNDELHAELTKSRKRRCDNQDPPPSPPKDSDQSKKKKHDSDISASK
ncbi:hypothetical protein Tco_1306605 [Tanacetum coccineum]